MVDGLHSIRLRTISQLMLHVLQTLQLKVFFFFFLQCSIKTSLQFFVVNRLKLKWTFEPTHTEISILHVCFCRTMVLWSQILIWDQFFVANCCHKTAVFKIGVRQKKTLIALVLTQIDHVAHRQHFWLIFVVNIGKCRSDLSFFLLKEHFYTFLCCLDINRGQACSKTWANYDERRGGGERRGACRSLRRG